jgi:RNA polymerase sigma factor (sigma-70 family)
VGRLFCWATTKKNGALVIFQPARLLTAQIAARRPMEQEFTRLLNTHPGILYKVCRLYAPTEADRQDLYQEIVLQLWRAFPQFRGEAKASTWLYRVALNTAIANFRRAQRRPAASTVPDEWLQQLPDLRDSAADERHAQLYAAIAQLSAVEKALITLYLDDHSHAEIGAMLGLTASHVGVKLLRTRAKLAQLITHLPA